MNNRLSDDFASVAARLPHHNWERYPWMYVRLTGESRTWEFALVVFSGWIVHGAPVAAKRHVGQRARDSWRVFAQRNAKLARLELPHDERMHLLEVRFRDGEIHGH